MRAGVRLPGVPGGTVPIDGITPAGGNAWFQVRAWERAYGATYEEALAQPFVCPLVGTSNIIKVDTGDPTTVPGGTPGVMFPALKGFYVIPCPEPSAFGLSAVGGLGLLLLLRRNKPPTQEKP